MVWIENDTRSSMVNLAAISCFGIYQQAGVTFVKAFIAGEDSEDYGWVSIHQGTDDSARKYYDWLLQQLDSADMNHRIIRQPDLS